MRRRFCIGLGLLAATLLSTACSTVKTSSENSSADLARYQQRAKELAAVEVWALKGRLAVSDENDGGSGTLRWRVDPDGSRMDFHGAMGRGAWQLESGGGWAELKLADGSAFSAASVGDLVRGQLGWEIPVEALSWWVRGLAVPESEGQKILGEDGTLSFLNQNGWAIEFGRYREVDGFVLPSKLTARNERKTVKLVIRDWETGGDE